MSFLGKQRKVVAMVAGALALAGAVRTPRSRTATVRARIAATRAAS